VFTPPDNKTGADPGLPDCDNSALCWKKRLSSRLANFGFCRTATQLHAGRKGSRLLGRKTTQLHAGQRLSTSWPDDTALRLEKGSAPRWQTRLFCRTTTQLHAGQKGSAPRWQTLGFLPDDDSALRLEKHGCFAGQHSSWAGKQDLALYRTATVRQGSKWQQGLEWRQCSNGDKACHRHDCCKVSAPDEAKGVTDAVVKFSCLTRQRCHRHGCVTRQIPETDEVSRWLHDEAEPGLITSWKG